MGIDNFERDYTERQKIGFGGTFKIYMQIKLREGK